MKIINIVFFKRGLFFSFLFTASQFIYGQNPPIVPFDSLHWDIQAKEIKMEDFQGKKCLKMIDGAAYLKDNFENGIIDFDICFDKERCFPGLMFRIADAKNYEFLYLRPHQSGNPDAIQYCPIIYGIDSWQLYNGEGYCAQREFAMNSWIHVKVIISGEKAELYLNDESLPTLYMYHLQRKPATGGLALDNHSPATVRFANFYYTKSDAPTLKTVGKKIPALEPGIVKKWQVSNGFTEKALNNKVVINNEDVKNLKWQAMEVEELGFINIGKYIAKTPEENTVFAKFTVESDKAQITKMALGFSDRCRVYLNGKIVYAGDNTFRSRDYRFYGTIGFWDDIFLDLQKGKNEVAIAISENFGGWGVEARFDNLNDLVISDR